MMNKKYIQHVFYLALVLLSLDSCKTSKKTMSTANVLNVKSKSHDSLAYTTFFEAEKARLLGENKNALSLYRTYLANNKSNPVAYFNIARIQNKMSMSAEAELNAKKAYELDANNKFYAEFYIDLLAYNLKYQEAYAINNKLLQTYPSNEEYLFKKAQLLIRLQKYNEAINAMNETEKVIGINDDIIFQKKELYIKQGKFDEAAVELDKLIQQDVLDPRYYIIKAEMYEKYKQKDKASELYKEIEQKFSKDAIAQVSLAKYNLDHKNIDGYNNYMKQVMLSKDMDVDTKISLLSPLLRKINADSNNAEQDNILSMVKNIYDAEPNNTSAINLYADVLYYSKKDNEAISIYKQYIEKDKSKYNPWGQLLAIYTSKREYDSVLHISNKSIQYFPNNSLTYFYKGLAYSMKKENTNAINNYIKSLGLNSENKELQAQVYSSLADAYNTEKEFTKSDSVFELSLKILPEDASTLNNYAYYLSVRNTRLQDAERMSKKSLEISPNQKSYLDTYGWILFRQKKYTEAKEYIEQAIKVSGDSDGTLYEHLGDVYYFMNQKDKALENWKLAVEKGESAPLLFKKIKDMTYYE